ncbi:protein odr-4 [Dorcoceras hygrometricum]|uniref:Protein odr-4 n=1 Tax=Dorcoceras hygrometricum TaxID=472368 RepID=A0A2Z7CSK4_9LAMI|nr:protein odr-4 [Dorcoceras hygrometricum]
MKQIRSELKKCAVADRKRADNDELYAIEKMSKVIQSGTLKPIQKTSKLFQLRANISREETSSEHVAHERSVQCELVHSRGLKSRIIIVDGTTWEDDEDIGFEETLLSFSHNFRAGVKREMLGVLTACGTLDRFSAEAVIIKVF